MNISKTNKHRAGRAEKALQARNDECTDQGLDPQGDVASLVADLRHFCLQRGVDFEKALDLSLEHFTGKWRAATTGWTRRVYERRKQASIHYNSGRAPQG